MDKRGIKPKGKVKIKWSPHFAYAIGLITTDGCLYNDGRHISLTTKDIEQARNFKKCLGISVKIGTKTNGMKSGICYYVQFGDVRFYRFLVSLGLTPAKSKTIGKIFIPRKYFFDFLRGSFDGDGTFYSYWDKRWKSSFMFYTEFVSASKKHIYWLRGEVSKRLHIQGHVTKTNTHDFYHLKYAKSDSKKILRKMYYSKSVICLSRKRLKIKKVLAMITK